MTQEEKILVLQDISGRLLYDVVIHTNLKDIKLDKKHRYIGVLYYEDYSDEFKKRCNYDTNHFSIIVSGCHYEDVKPYLRPLSSMTEEETKEYRKPKLLSGLKVLIVHMEGIMNIETLLKHLIGSMLITLILEV